MRGPTPKDPESRQRRNVKPSRAILTAADAPKRAPMLPRDAAQRAAWHPMTLAWWRDIWRSPMASRWLEADRHALYRLAVLVDDWWHVEDTKLQVAVAAEIRQQEQRFGLTPVDRLRLEWIVEQAEAPKAAPDAQDDEPGDPRVTMLRPAQ